jgi:AcrR family transcriptional regulator
MVMDVTRRRTPKGEMTQQRILDSALTLFANKGYEQTTMRDIAVAADCSLGLTYRYFASKEDLILALYDWLADRLDEQALLLPAGNIADRFQRLMRALFEVMTPHRRTLAALFGAALNPHSRAGLFGASGAGIRQRARSAYVALVTTSKDRPSASQADDLATLLYGVQLALVLFWLQDLAPRAHRTNQLLDFIHDALVSLRPLLRLPLVSQMLARLVAIIGPLLGGNDKSDETNETDAVE